MLGVQVADLVQCTLEQLAERVERHAADRLDELRDRAVETFDFRSIEPNFAHEAAALLLREGLVQLISVNWDCGIERAGVRAEVRIAGVATATQRLQLVDELPLYKVHGCARQPETIALTQAEVDKPQRWAVALVQNAIAGGFVVFVGLGTVGLYVGEPVTELLEIWTSGATVKVVDPDLRELWRKALGDRADEAHVRMGAEEFLDDLLRATVRDALDEVEQAVQLLVGNEEWASSMDDGCHLIRTAFERITADAAMHWWRDGVVDTQAGAPFITELPGKRALMTVALLAGGEGAAIETRGVRGRLTVGTPSQYFEIVCRPGDHVSDVERVARGRIARRLEEGVYLDGRMITVVVPEAMGQFPAPDAPVDIAAGGEEPTDIGAGVSATRVRLVSAEEAVQGRLAA
jgi:hypothetical protein